MSSRRKGRILAFQALYCWEASRLPVEELLEFDWLDADKKARLDPGIADFSRLLIAGTIGNIKEVDSMIRRHLLNWDIKRLNRVDLSILRISTYTLMFQQDMSPTIVIDEAIGISREFGADDSFRFINGVLDSIRKNIQGESLPCPSPN
jgi:N utilization substance protein B